MKTMDRFNSGLGVSHVLARRAAAAWLVSGIALALAQPARADWVAAAGGTEMSYTENGTNYHAHIFATTGANAFTVTQGGEVEVLVVAGGGGGGEWNAGGGGAGGLIYTSTVVDAGSISVTVGSGGDGGVGGTSHADGRSGSNGSNSVFGAFTAIGGGGGGGHNAGVAGAGGSGGGGRWSGGPETAAGTEGQGHAGGAGLSTADPYAGAGGGGAGEDGQSANPGNGGAGLEFPQFALFGGSPAGWFAGGGGGGGNSGSGTGGLGGGGAGQNGTSPASGGTPGVAGTGGGGGGGGLTGKGPGGNGGSGIVIIRYIVPQPQVAKWAVATGGTETNFTENGIDYHAHIFTATGPNTFYVFAGGAVEYLVVGGGGAGRGNGDIANSGSGGSGGQLISGLFSSVPAGVLSVTVGAGGVGVVNASGGPGGDSAFWTITAAGGAGGSYGSSSEGTYGGNGAGGAGAGHGDGPLGNAGGPGLASTILGSSVTYAGGGGGGFSHGGNAGSGGGGRGESYSTGTAESGAANTGGGGGGVSNGGATPGKNGGSGIVIIRYQRQFPSDNLINLDINGYGLAPNDGVPGTGRTCFGAAAVGAAADYWNSAAIADSTFETLAAPLLKMADGLTSTTVRFTLSKPGGLLHADWRHEDGKAVTNLLDDYVYINPGDTPASDTFTISGLFPNATYDLYFYCHAGIDYKPGRFTINSIQYDSIYDWVTTGDYAKCLGIASDGNGVITGTFSQADPGNAAVLNGLQIVGTLPVSQAEIVNIDLNGFYGNPLGAGSTYVGAARVGGAGDYWNGVAVSDGSTNVIAPNLKLANGITNTAVSFSLSSTVVGGKVHGNGRPSLNAMFNDYVFITDGSAAIDGSSDRFTISGLVPNAAYDLYFYCHEFNLYNPGRFVINGKTYDSIDMSFPASGGGDTAICAGITADAGGQIIGEFSQAAAPLPVVVNGLQIVGAFPRRQADLVNIDLNGYGPENAPNVPDPPPVEGDTYSGAARVGADGDYWNSLTIGTETVTNITASRLKFADGATKSKVSFTIGRVDGLLNADRIAPQVYLNSLMGDYVYYYNGTGTFTIAGLYPDTAYDLYFYCGGGSLYFPVRFEINGLTYDSFDHWFEGSPYGDYAVCAGIMADGSGSITGTFYKATPDSATCVSGVQIMGRIPLAPKGTIILLH